MADGFRSDFPKEGLCVGEDARLFERLDAGDMTVAQFAVARCYECPVQLECLRGAAARRRGNGPGRIETVVAGEIGAITLPDELLCPAQDAVTREAFFELPSLVGTPQEVFARLQSIARERGTVLGTRNHAKQVEMASLVEAQFPLQMRSPEFAEACSVFAEFVGELSPTLLTPRFLLRHMPPYLENWRQLKALAIPYAASAAAFNTPETYAALQQKFLGRPHISEEHLKFALGAFPANPEQGLEQYLSRLQYATETLLPELRTRFAYTGPLPADVVERVCLEVTRPRTIEYRLTTLFRWAVTLDAVFPGAPFPGAAEASPRHILQMAVKINNKLQSHDLQVDTATKRALSRLRFAARRRPLELERPVSWDARLLDYALRINRRSYTARAPAETLWAAHYIIHATDNYGATYAGKGLPEGWASQVRLARAYMHIVARWRSRGVERPEIAACYYDTHIVATLRRTYGAALTMPAIVYALSHHPADLNRFIQRFLRSPDDFSVL